jgi:hypothetical protein
MHVYENPCLIAIMVIMLALLVVNEVHKRKARRERERLAPPTVPRSKRATDPVWKDRGSL